MSVDLGPVHMRIPDTINSGNKNSAGSVEHRWRGKCGRAEGGHTASLFPGAAALADALDMNSRKTCTGIVSSAAPRERMTLTLPAILNSRQIMVHIVGEGKRRVYEEAASDGPVDVMPIRAILRQSTVPVTVFWAP